RHGHLLRYLFLFCFFFQAEDGIRDFHVTGVQTCALPISSRNGKKASEASTAPLWRPLDFSTAMRTESTRLICPAPTPTTCRSFRSEERRVGKECGSRWSP